MIGAVITYALAGFALGILLVLGLALPALGLLLFNSFRAGMIYLMLVFGADAVFYASTRLQLGINVYPNDIAFAFLGAVAAARWVFATDIPRRPLPWVTFVALFFLSLALGLATFGTAAGVQARNGFYSVVAASYFMSFAADERRVREFFDALAIAALGLVLLCAYRWTVYVLQIRDLLPPGGVWSIDGPTRVIAAHEALLMAQVLVLGLFFPGSAKGARVARWLAPLLLGVVVALQHRSVWIAGLVGVVSALAVSRSAIESRLGQFAALVLVIALTALPLAFSERLSGLTGEIGRSAATALAGQRTVHSRLQDWRQTIREWSQAGPKVILIGYSFGRDTTRSITTESGERRNIQFSAHNHYVALLTELGILGLSAFLLLVFPALIALYRSCARDSEAVIAPALLALMAMQLAYYVPYGTNYLQHALLGVTVAFLAAAAQRTATPAGRVLAADGGLRGNAA